MIIIKKAKTDDSKEIANLIQRYLGKDYKPFKFTKEMIEEKIKDKKNTFYISTDKNKVIGVLRSSLEDIDLTDLRWWVVEKSYRNKKIGTKLLKFALKDMKKKKIRKVIARTKVNSSESIRILLRLGFYIEGYFKEHYRKCVDIIQFAKFLNE